MESRKLQVRINLLIAYVIVLTLAFGWFIYSHAGAGAPGNIEELTVRRINITGADGSLRMVLSNEDRQHPGRINGKDLPPRARPAGIIFFDDYGNECGGLVFNERQDEDHTYKMMSFTMDNYKNDQVMQLINEEQYEGDEASIKRGYIINEYPVGADLSVVIKGLDSIDKISDSGTRQKAKEGLFAREGAKRRMFMGMLAKQTGLFLYDKAGQAKVKIYIDEKGNPKIEVLDAQGTVRDVLAGLAHK